MTDLRFLYSHVRAHVLAWFLLALMSALMELFAINALLPLIFDERSFVGGHVRNLYTWAGVGDQHLFQATIVAFGVLYVVRNVFMAASGTMSAKMHSSINENVAIRLLRGVGEAGYLPLQKINRGDINNAILRETHNISVAVGAVVRCCLMGMFAIGTFGIAMMIEPMLVILLLVALCLCL